MTALNKQALREAVQEEIMLRSVSDTSDAWQDEASPEAVLALLDELEAAEKRIAEAYAGWGNCQLTMGVYCHAYEEAKTHIAELIHNHRVHAARLIDERIVLKERIAELEAKLETADKLQDSAFRHGLQHGFSYGQTNDQAGFEQCLAAYSQEEKGNG